MGERITRLRPNGRGCFNLALRVSERRGYVAPCRQKSGESTIGT
jgi:hypothetical protein